MLRILNSVFIQRMDASYDKYKAEFYNHRIMTNLSRCKLFGLVVLSIHLPVLILNLILYKSIRLEPLNNFRLYYSHILLFIFNFFWLIFLQYSEKYMDNRKIEIHCYEFTIINLFWHVFQGLLSSHYNGTNSSYLICILSISICLFLTPFEAFLTCFSSLIFILIGIIHIIHFHQLKYSLITTSTATAIIAYIISRYKFKYFLEDFANKKRLVESKIELEKTNQKLKEYEKLRSEFFANISHELKTPINVIFCAQQMMITLIDKNQTESVYQQKYLNMIKQNSYRLIRLVGNLIDITKIGTFSFSVKLINADIVKITEDIIISVASFVEHKGLSITFDTFLEEKIIACDPEQIERIILNLISNSVKFTDKGGNIFVNIYSENNNICISVKDTGIGIPKDMQNLIFERFIQVDKSISKNSEGCGIGLSLVKALVEMHEGHISINSKLGKGSEFIVELPDILLDEDTKKIDSSITKNDYVEKINIEFSDIYD